MNRRYGLYYAASVYLLYLVYGLVSDLKNGQSDNPAVSVAAAVFFVAAAAAIALYARHKSKMESAGAAGADAGSEEEGENLSGSEAEETPSGESSGDKTDSEENTKQ